MMSGWSNMMGGYFGGDMGWLGWFLGFIILILIIIGIIFLVTWLVKKKK